MSNTLKTDLLTLINQVDDDMLWLIYCLMLKLVSNRDKNVADAPSTHHHFLEKLHKVQALNAFSDIDNSVEWQKQLRNEWE